MTKSLIKFEKRIHDVLQIVLSSHSPQGTIEDALKLIKAILMKGYKAGIEKPQLFSGFGRYSLSEEVQVVLKQLFNLPLDSKRADALLAEEKLWFFIRDLIEDLSKLDKKETYIDDLLRNLKRNYLHKTKERRERFFLRYLNLIGCDIIYKSELYSDEPFFDKLEYIKLFNDQVASFFKDHIDKQFADQIIEVVDHMFLSLNFFVANHFEHDWYDAFYRLQSSVTSCANTQMTENIYFDEDIFELRDGVFTIENTKQRNDFLEDVHKTVQQKIKNCKEEKSRDQVKKAFEQVQKLSTDYLKSLHILDLFFFLGTYCYKSKHYKVINYLWHGFFQKNPNLSNPATLVPQSYSKTSDQLDCFIRIYFNQELNQYYSGFYFSENFADTFAEYSLLLLFDIFRKDQSPSFSVTRLSSNSLISLVNSRAPALKKQADFLIRKIENNEITLDIFVALGFIESEFDKSFEILKSVKSFLAKLIEVSNATLEKRISDSNLDSELVSNFEEKYRKAFEENTQFRKIFQIGKKERKGDRFLFLQNTFVEKEWFASDYPGDFDGAGAMFGQAGAKEEDHYVISQFLICNKLKTVEHKTKVPFSSWLANEITKEGFALENIIVFFDRSVEFPVYKNLTTKDPNYFYEYGDNDLPEHYYKLSDPNPDFNSQSSSITYLPIYIPHLRMGIKSVWAIDITKLDLLSSKLEVKIKQADQKEFLNNPPDWFFDKYKTEEQQNKFLAEKVILESKEQIDIIFHNDVIGLCINVDSFDE